jgi:hypothetical protein
MDVLTFFIYLPIIIYTTQAYPNTRILFSFFFLLLLFLLFIHLLFLLLLMWEQLQHKIQQNAEKAKKKIKLDGPNGTLYSQAGDSNTAYHNSRLQVGNVLTCIFNKTTQEDGKALGVAFRSISSDELYPAIDCFDQNVKLTLVF